MNFLQLVQRHCREIGIPGTGPSSVVGQTGELGRAVNHVKTAWLDIQAEHQDWQWLRASITPKATVNQQAVYTLADLAITDFGMWDTQSFRCYLTSGGTATEIELEPISYQDWRSIYQLGTARTTTSRPAQFCVLPDKSIGLGPVPTGDYTITADYYTAPVELALDADEPAMPSQWHMAIVYRAMMAAGAFDAATEVYQRGEVEYNKMMNRIERDRLPPVLLGGALA